MRESKYPSLEELAHRKPLSPESQQQPGEDYMAFCYRMLGGPMGGVTFGPNAKPPWDVAKVNP